MISAPEKQQLKYDFCKRRVERGARIVAVFGISLVLQMPRGNLETVFPRSLVLAKFASHIDRGEFYPSAFMLARRHRLDLNLIHDCNPASFLSWITTGARTFAVDHLNILLAAFTDVDVGGDYFSGREEPKVESGGKVDQICLAVYDALVDSNDASIALKFRTSIITTLICRREKNLEAVLSLVREIRDTESSVEAESAVKYAGFILAREYREDPFRKLYDAALGMYDFGLCILAAGQSDKMDPREYIPFLSQLESIENANTKRFRINVYLCRFETAFGNLVDDMVENVGGDFSSQCVDFVSRHEIYKFAMELLQRNTDLRPIYLLVVQRYAEHLADTSLMQEAAICMS
jgi:elongator complex protein 1